ncbi:hypothetical protein R75465_02237 [Paraburkholderia aspalathi]|uniref:cyanobactin maturation protease PatG family protein n=1 Tax=Paraburkholderia aspalathi TaxID=1324617 RepID=UPI001B2D3505|nr:hypothetical protein [Paraburkholderia aspalathi]CAE6740273.1 hypothetical protein R75465_02237 [Paraburkholderia aspalathi]
MSDNQIVDASTREVEPSAVAATDPIASIETSNRSSSITPSSGCGCSECGCSIASKCSCGSSGGLVYALGTIGIDFGSPAARDSFLGKKITTEIESLTVSSLDASVLDRLEKHPYLAESIIWTLNINSQPVYAIQPGGAYPQEVYMRLAEYAKDQMEAEAESADSAPIVTLPGKINGPATRLISGRQIPTVETFAHGFQNFTIDKLVDYVVKEAGLVDNESDIAEISNIIKQYLNKIYNKYVNLGRSPKDRALNFSAINLFSVAKIFAAATSSDFDLDEPSVRSSPFSRDASDCYDVELSFFNPQNTNSANRVYSFTVDVSAPLPVQVGRYRYWNERSR